MKENDLCGNWPVELATLPDKNEPSKVGVVLHNDDFTPMEFVLTVLTKIFFLEEERAKQVMLKAHTEGKACIGWFVREIAETKAEHANRYAREEEHPLLCSTEVAV